MIFVDEANIVVARRWCWRQSAASAAGDDTTEILVTVEGHHAGAADEVGKALDDLALLIRVHAGAGNVRRAILTVEDPAFE